MKSLILILALGAQSVFSASFIVKLKNNQVLSPTQTTSLFQTQNVSLSQLSIGTFYLVDLKEVGPKELQRIKTDPLVEYVEQNQMISITPIVESEITSGSFSSEIDDPEFNKQWALKNDGKNGSQEGVDLKAIDSWGYSKGDKKIKIAIIDTGVDYTHPDLKDNIFVNEAEANGTPGVDDDKNGYVDDIHGYDFANKDGDPMDDNKHGSHCAGIIAAVHNNLGVRGIMRDVSIIPIKFLKGSGQGSTMGAIESIDYAIKMGADIMSNSWGMPVKGGLKKGGGKPKFNKALVDAIKRAEEKGILFIAAAGNSKADTDKTFFSPAGIPLANVISVGSHDSAGARSSFSNYGAKTVHVMAPGTKIFSTINGGNYAALSGTSMATPYVSGVAGLILSLEPSLTPTEVKERLIGTSLKSSDLESASISKGRVDALRALKNITN